MNAKDDWNKELKREFKKLNITSAEQKKEQQDQILKQLKRPVFYVNFCYQYDGVIKLNDKIGVLKQELALCKKHAKPKYVREGFLWLRKRELSEEKIEE